MLSRTSLFFSGSLLLLATLGCGGGGGNTPSSTPTVTPAVTISPTNPSVPAGTVQAFAASITNGTNSHGFAWSMTSGEGMVFPAGSPMGTQATYFAPGVAGAASITATSLDYPNASAQTTITITALPSVTVTRYPMDHADRPVLRMLAGTPEGSWFIAGDLPSFTEYYVRMNSAGVFTWYTMPPLLQGTSPSQVAHALASGGPNNKLYVLGGANGELLVHRIDPATGLVEASIPTGTSDLDLNFGLGVDGAGNIWTNDLDANLNSVLIQIPAGGGTPIKQTLSSDRIFLENPLVDATGAWWLAVSNPLDLFHATTTGVTPFATPLGNPPIGPASGGMDGSLWISDGSSLAKFVPGTGFQVPILPALGLQSYNPASLLGTTPDGRFWFGCTNVSDGTPYLGVINPDGSQAYFKFTLSPVGVAVSLDRGLIGADGKFYFLDKANRAVLVLSHP